MRFELYIARRYLFSKTKQTFISIISFISIIGVAIGVAALVVVMGVYNGFTKDVTDKILGANAHILVMSPDPAAFDSHFFSEGVSLPLASPILEQVKNLPGVHSATPYIYAEVLFSSPRGATGLVLQGIDPHQAQEALTMLARLDQGQIENLTTDTEQNAPGIIIGRQLAERFGVQVGNRVNLMSPAGQRSTTGFSPKITAFRVVGIFNSGMSDYDSRKAYISLEAAQNLLGLPVGRVTGLEVYTSDPYDAAKVAAALENELGFPFVARNWMDTNAGLFAALKLERIGMFIVLLMIILVASFSIITSLVMLVMEKTKDIAILMSMGATAKMIRRIFTYQGIIIGAIGTALGYTIGLTLALLLKKYQFIQLPPGIYIVDHLPMLISAYDTVFIGIASMLMCLMATVYPSRKAAGLQPVEALRYE